MKKVLIVFGLVLFACPVIAQDRTRILQYRHYDTTVAENQQANWTKYKNRRLNTHIDSTGIFVSAWGDNCWLKIKLRNHTDNMDHYQTGTYNGYPYVKYGNDKYRYRMYMTKGGAFEFDAIIRARPISGRYFFPFDIRSQGLRFSYQPELMAEEISMGAERPDSVVGSYAVYRSDGVRGVIKYADGSVNRYGTGKVCHIYTPKVWDASGDTIWGFIEIDTILQRMRIGADSTWMANATYPVTIDPQFGNTDIGASTLGLSGYSGVVQVTMAATEGQVLDSVVFNGWGDTDPTSTAYGGIYEDDGGPGPGVLGEGDITGITITWLSQQWYQCPMAGTYALTSEETYWLAFYSDAWACKYDASGAGEYKVTSSWPDPYGAPYASGEYDLSIYGVYSAATAEGLSGRRRRIITIGGGNK